MIERCLGHRAAARTWFARALRAQPALLAPLGARREEGTRDEAARRSCSGSLAALLAPAAASAHPLGNFTINRFSRDRGLGHRALRRSTCSTWPRSRPSRPAASTPRAYARRIARERAPDRRRHAPVALVPLGARARASARRRRPAHDAARGRAPRARRSTARARSPTATATTRIASAGRRSSSARTRRAAATSCARIRRTCSRARSTSRARPAQLAPGTGADVAARALARHGARRRPTGSPTRGFASLVGREHLVAARDPRLARRGAVLGRGARALARARQDDRHGVPRRPARHAVARGAARADRHGDAHGRRLRARPRHARALAVHRPRPALPVAEPRLGAARGRRSAPRCCAGPPLPRPRTARHGHSHDHGTTASRPRHHGTPRHGTPSTTGPELPLAARRRHLGRPAALPVGARRAARRDLAAPGRLRPAR